MVPQRPRWVQGGFSSQGWEGIRHGRRGGAFRGGREQERTLANDGVGPGEAGGWDSGCTAHPPRPEDGQVPWVGGATASSRGTAECQKKTPPLDG